VADEIISEPTGGAHSDWDATSVAVKKALVRNLAELMKMKTDPLLKARWAKYESMGAWGEPASDTSTNA